MADIFETEYEITPGRLVKIITYFIIYLFVFLIVFIPIMVYSIEGEEFQAFIIIFLLLIIMVPILIGSWAYSPQKYIVSEKRIKIVRPINSVSIPLHEITKVEDRIINPLKTIRLWANGGLFSLSGTYYNKTDGKFLMYAKNDNYVMIYADKKYVLSPDEKERFMIEVQNKLEKAGKRRA
jgi:hypothetical protein